MTYSAWYHHIGALADHDQKMVDLRAELEAGPPPPPPGAIVLDATDAQAEYE